jgi:hypothetical protein
MPALFTRMVGWAETFAKDFKSLEFTHTGVDAIGGSRNDDARTEFTQSLGTGETDSGCTTSTGNQRGLAIK